MDLQNFGRLLIHDRRKGQLKTIIFRRGQHYRLKR